MDFVGNVLSPTKTQPEQDDPSFAFSFRESLGLKLENVPIHMEHDKKMKSSSELHRNKTKMKLCCSDLELLLLLAFFLAPLASDY